MYHKSTYEHLGFSNHKEIRVPRDLDVQLSVICQKPPEGYLKKKLTYDLTLFPKMYIGTEASQQNA